MWALLQRQGVESEDPSVVGTRIAIGGEGHVQRCPGQQQAGSLVLKVAGEGDLAARRPEPGPRNASLDHHRTSELLRSVGKVEGVESVAVRSGLLRQSDDVDDVLR